MRRAGAILLAIVSISVGYACEQKPQTFDPTLTELVPKDLWQASNHGRVPIGKDGYFTFPEGVRRVWIDVGAFKLHETSRFLRVIPDLAIIAIEPMAEPWKEWPDDPRVVGLPVAISLERDILEFNVNVGAESTSSLLDTTEGNLFEKFMGESEVRKVPSVRLEDVFERIPPELSVEYVKTDIQGMDLPALQSAGPHLRRVKEVLTEIMNLEAYKADRDGAMATEEEFNEYMASVGFSPAYETTTPDRWWVNAFYTNDHWEGPEDIITPLSQLLERRKRREQNAADRGSE